ncbi:hypothetical protein [Nannocystis sp. SCPEA4]|uniref:hypothetical protein n=1 Tax=Nannocystis sp. SCPEA4 TaxID=2996787 RepID=UPI00226FEA9D|nr:hypothetical protein [Nannocystis sp. SCPEA4]MCY1059023.1 hypothetical protein [Nannocystis sp. SCPEA4]
MTAHDPTRTPYIRRCHHWRCGLFVLLAAACTRQPEQPKARPAPVDTRTKMSPPAGPREATPPPVSGVENPGAAAAPEPGTELPGGEAEKKPPTRADEHK